MNWNQSFFDFSQRSSATKRWNTLWSNSPFFFFFLNFFYSFERPRRWKELKALWVRVETESVDFIKALYTSLWLYQIFRRSWWMWNRLSERRGWVRVERVSESGAEVWEWERETGLCERKGEWEYLEWGINFEKTLIWNRVLETRFPGLPRCHSQIAMWTSCK